MNYATQTFFTPVETLLGGYLLHMSTTALLEDTGVVLGVSGITDGLIWGTRVTKSSNGRGKGSGPKDSLTSERVKAATHADEWVEKYWRWAVVGGMVIAPASFQLLGIGGSGLSDGSVGDAVKSWQTIQEVMGVGRLAIAGLLVGIGSRLGSGCTSGHFLCGASRLSPRSIVATATFFPIAMLTSQLVPMRNLSIGLVSQPSYAPILPGLNSWPSLFIPLVLSHLSRLILRRSIPSSPQPLLRLLPYLLSGWTFGMGLVLSGMANPLKVLSFLRISPLDQWDPSLAMVFLGGVLPNAFSYRRFISRGARNTPSTLKPNYGWATWRVPTRKDIDWRLIVGAATFGVGWGLGGVCPGPAIVGLGGVGWEQGMRLGKSAASGLGVFVVSMALGMRLGRAI